MLRSAISCITVDRSRSLAAISVCVRMIASSCWSRASFIRRLSTKSDVRFRYGIGARTTLASLQDHGHDHACEPGQQAAADPVQRRLHAVESNPHFTPKLDHLGFDPVKTLVDGIKT